jgi:phage terminase small subunit
MARPRTPSNVLELRGAFKVHPGRKRKDAEGAGPFNSEPPVDLPPTAVPAWRALAQRVPKISLSSSDEFALGQAARVLAGIWELDKLGGAINPMFPKLSAELRQWLIQLGMTPQARTKIPQAPEKTGGNAFADV